MPGSGPCWLGPRGASYHQSSRRPHLRPSDRILWSWVSRGWVRWREVLVFAQPATVLAGQRQWFRDHGARLSRRHPGRPAMPTDIRELIRARSVTHPR